jgi:hypothetical protein
MESRDQDILRRAIIKAINKAIDRKYHRLFDDPERCLDAVISDAAEHIVYERIFGLTDYEINERLRKYYLPALAKCLAKNFTDNFY